MSDKHLIAKQEKFALLYLELGNASESYRRSYDVGNMDDRTAQKRAQELLHHPGVAARIAELQKAAADKAILNREWVLSRLIANAQVSLGEKTITLRVQRRDKETGNSRWRRSRFRRTTPRRPTERSSSLVRPRRSNSSARMRLRMLRLLLRTPHTRNA